jgi:hypothetical protein
MRAAVGPENVAPLHGKPSHSSTSWSVCRLDGVCAALAKALAVFGIDRFIVAAVPSREQTLKSISREVHGSSPAVIMCDRKGDKMPKTQENMHCGQFCIV